MSSIGYRSQRVARADSSPPGLASGTSPPSVTKATVTEAGSSMGAAGVTWSKRGRGTSVASRSPARRARTRSTARVAALASSSTDRRGRRPMRPSSTVSSAPRSRALAAPPRVSSDGPIDLATSPEATTGAAPASSSPGLSGCMDATALSPAAVAAATTRAQASP